MTTPDSTAVEEPRPAGEPGEVLLEVSGLQKHFPVTRGAIFKRQVGAVKAVDGIDFAVRTGETLGLVGESGCGKTTTGRMITRLLEPTGGKIVFEGQDITHVSQGTHAAAAARHADDLPGPVLVAEPAQDGRHDRRRAVPAAGRRDRGAASRRPSRTCSTLVGLNPEHYNRYPHEFSGGQRQRIGIARTLALRPKLIVADEPVSALDVSIQAQVVNLLEDLQDEFGLTYVVIAHDLSVVRHISDRVGVMYLGKIVELADTQGPLRDADAPVHGGAAVGGPGPGPDAAQNRDRIRLQGDVPSPLNPPPACRFHTRCWKAQEICGKVEPPMVELAPGHQVACHFPENAPADARGRIAKAAGHRLTGW